MSEEKGKSKSKSTGIKERIIAAVMRAMNEVKKTGTPVGVEIIRSENFVFQLLVVPPGTQQYGATTVQRTNPAVLPQIRSRRLWRNSLTIKQFEYLREIQSIINAVMDNEELAEAIREVMTPRETTKPSLVIEI